ncbi:hypothetical protein TIFTF001_001896 [Ficus carica]|uniref:Tetraspanin-19 n=1 Tax=Ficus carica TaxID=3494 RepID=A0AA88CR77_FICCA|nr:hypothetical protein TIFTF001_001896 [Ficus carica]
MGRMVRSCVQSILKLVNSVIGMVGLAMILYALWLIRVWQKQMGDFPFGDSDYPPPWFIYTFLGLGITLCVITCSGHVAAATINEAAVTADVFLNRDWEEDFPEDPSGSFDQFKDFVRSNFHICKWIGLSIVSVQGLCFLFAIILKALGPHRYYDSDDDYLPQRAPLLQNAVQDPVYGSRPNAWNARINNKSRKLDKIGEHMVRKMGCWVLSYREE